MQPNSEYEYVIAQQEEEAFNTSAIIEQKRKEAEESLIKFEHNFRELLDETEYLLKGFVFDTDTEKWTKKHPAMLSDDGINSIMLDLRTRVSKAHVLSNYQTDDINGMLWDLVRQIILQLFMMAEEWEVDMAHMTQIVNLIEHQARAIFQRALLAGEREIIGRTHTTREVFNPAIGPQMQQKSKWRDALPF